MKIKQGKPQIDRAEWCFDDTAKKNLAECYNYEFARESKMLRLLFQKAKRIAHDTLSVELLEEGYIDHRGQWRPTGIDLPIRKGYPNLPFKATHRPNYKFTKARLKAIASALDREENRFEWVRVEIGRGKQKRGPKPDSQNDRSMRDDLAALGILRIKKWLKDTSQRSTHASVAAFLCKNASRYASKPDLIPTDKLISTNIKRARIALVRFESDCHARFAALLKQRTIPTGGLGLPLS
jgi:hypothetical protein